LHIVVVANGELPPGYERAVRTLLERADLVIAADGALTHCRALGMWPSVLVGDLDSAPQELVAQAGEHGVEVREFPTDKDATDLELALEAARAAGATSISVIAAFGGRLDHELAAISLIASDQMNGIAVDAFDGRRHLMVVRGALDLNLSIGTTLSLVPWGGDVTGVTTRGLQWPLAAETLPFGTTRGVSNVAIDAQQFVSISDGVLLAISDGSL
jgi:thiamine pyrophosphokinase